MLSDAEEYKKQTKRLTHCNPIHFDHIRFGVVSIERPFAQTNCSTNRGIQVVVGCDSICEICIDVVHCRDNSCEIWRCA